MIKYFIDTSVTTLLPKQYKTTIDDEEVTLPGELSVDYAVEIVMPTSQTAPFNTFCQSVTLDGQDISYAEYTKDDRKTLIIPARTLIQNYSSLDYDVCKAVPYKTKI